MSVLGPRNLGSRTLKPLADAVAVAYEMYSYSAPMYALALCGAAELASAFSIAPIPLRTPARASASGISMMEGKGKGDMTGDVSRRSALALGIFGGISALSPSKASAEDKQLSPEEMAEYKKLLKQAFRIQDVIDANVEATKESLGGDGDENELQEYLRKKKEGTLETPKDDDDKPQSLVPIPKK